MRDKINTGIRLLCYYILPLVMFLALYSGVLTPAQEFFLAAYLGLWTIRGLAIILFARPLFVLFPKKLKFLGTIIGQRRPLGVLIFLMGFFHGTYMFVSEGLVASPELLLEPLQFFFWGALAFIGMFILAITSNNISKRKLLGQVWWRRVHWLVYPVFGFAALHFAMGDGKITPILVFVLYLILKGLEWRKKHHHNKKHHS